jgi:hypothetical protein
MTSSDEMGTLWYLFEKLEGSIQRGKRDIYEDKKHTANEEQGDGSCSEKCVGVEMKVFRTSGS